MADGTKQNWAGRTGRKITDAQFEKVRQAASELPNLLSGIYVHLDKIYKYDDQKPIVRLAQNFIDLREVGSSRSQDDAFRALEGLTNENVTEAKDKWFAKVVALYRLIANALMKRELYDASPLSEEDKQRVPAEARNAFEAVMENMRAMEEVYSPSRSSKKK